MSRASRDLAAILERADALPGRMWAGYGMVVIIAREFPDHPPALTGDQKVSHSWPDIDMSFWAAAGAALTAAADAAHLPPLPLEEAWMTCLTANAGSSGKRYRPRWGQFR